MSRKIIETSHLIIRSFMLDDLSTIHRILDQAFGDGSKVDYKTAILERQAWLKWSQLNQEWLPKLHQPPYGDRAITLNATEEGIGAIGYRGLLTNP
jgi:hypothetical protein